jgi:hypothetical protein
MSPHAITTHKNNTDIFTIMRTLYLKSDCKFEKVTVLYLDKYSTLAHITLSFVALHATCVW